MTFYRLTVDKVYFQPPKSSQKKNDFLPVYEITSLQLPKSSQKKNTFTSL